MYKGFTNIELDDSSSFLTTMHTPICHYHWLCMPFGAEKDHYINLWNLMLRCREVNLKLNPKKFHFKVKQVTWMGHLLRSTGVTPHSDRVQAIKDMTPPHDVKGVQRFLGMCNYLSRCTPNLAEIVKPLTELTHGNAVWPWSSQHDKAFKPF